MKKLLIPALLLAVVATSCSKDDNIAPESSSKYLVRVDRTGDDEGPRILSYDGDKLITVVDSIDGKRTADSVAYKNGLIVASYYIENDGKVIREHEYEYDTNGRLTKVRNSRDEEELPGVKSYDSLAYNAAGKVSLSYRLYYTAGHTAEISSFTEFTWDTNGNLTVEKTSVLDDNGAVSFTYKNVYTYDSKSCFLATTGATVFWQHTYGYSATAKNNILTEEIHEERNGVLQIVALVTNTYTYNQEGDVATMSAKFSYPDDREDPTITNAVFTYGKR